MSQLLSGQLSHHRLESELKDPERAVRVRRLFLETQAASEGRSTAVGQLPINRLDGQQFYTSVLGSNCENVVGFVPLPVGVVGPLLLDGQSLTVPLATTEGALIASTNRGARAITAGGGAVSVLLAEGMTRAPVVQCTDLLQAAKLKAHFECAERLPELQQLFANTSRYGRLQSVSVAIAGRHAYIRFCCSTGDAMGMNMVGKGTNAVLMEVLSSFPGAELIALSGNYCTDKKPAAINWVNGRGKSVACEALIPGAIVRKVLKADPQRVAALNVHKNLVGSALAGSIGGFNAHASNLVTALFLACGQDPAQNVESSQCITTMEAVARDAVAEAAFEADADADPRDTHDLRIACTMPSVECGTVGGGTGLSAQHACLQILGVAGASQTEPGANAARLARIVCATVLCGELSLMSALSSNHLISAHLALNRKPAK